MKLQELARRWRKAKAEAVTAPDPAELPEHLAAQQRRIDAGLGYPPPPDWPGARDGWR